MEKLPSNLVKLRGWGKPSSFGYQEDSSSATKSPGGGLCPLWHKNENDAVLPVVLRIRALRSPKRESPQRTGDQRDTLLKKAGSGWDLQEGSKDLAGKGTKLLIRTGRRISAKERTSTHGAVLIFVAGLEWRRRSRAEGSEQPVRG